MEKKLNYSVIDSGKVIVEFAPINEKYWKENDVATINKGQIRLGGCWFNFDGRYKVKEIKQ